MRASRIVVSQALRSAALATESAVERSCALMGELSMLVRAQYVRRVLPLTDLDSGTERVGVGELRAWWVSYAHELVSYHHDLAREQLACVGVEA